MHTITKFENNSSRKSYRTNIPLHVIIDQKSYKAVDWSLTGLALVTSNFDIKPSETCPCVLVLQMPESAISIRVTLKLEYIDKQRYGFSFVNLSEKNKKVLRRFIELAIEGKTDVVDNIISIYEEPEISSPIHNPVKLDEHEKIALKRDFHRSAFRYILFALGVLTALIGLLFFNMRYSYEGTGVVMGNYYKVYPLQGGVVDRMYVHEGDNVKVNQPLVQLDSQDITYKIRLLEAQKEKDIATYHVLRKQVTHPNAINIENNNYIRSIKEKLALKMKQYQNAKIQYNQKLITYDRLAVFKDAYLDMKIKLENAKGLFLRQQINRRVEANPILLDTRKIDLKIEHAKDRLKRYRIKAPVSGKVYEIYSIEGEQVFTSRPVLTLWTKDEPYILVHVPNKYLSYVKPGTKADIYNVQEKTHYRAKVTKVGTVDESDSMLDVDVVLKLEGLSSILKPHQRIDVMFKRSW